MIAVRLLIVAIILGLSGWVGWELYSGGHLEREALVNWAQGSGGWAPVIIIGAIVIAVIVGPIPTIPMAVASGAIFGPWLGFLYAMLGGLLGATASFWLARLAGRPFVEHLLSGHVSFCEHCSDRMMFWVVLGARLIPIVSFALVSYGAGLTAMSTGMFLLATGLGMTPMTIVFVGFGASLTVDPWLAGGIGIVILILFVALPRLAERYNLFGVATRIRHAHRD